MGTWEVDFELFLCLLQFRRPFYYRPIIIRLIETITPNQATSIKLDRRDKRRASEKVKNAYITLAHTHTTKRQADSR